MKEGGDSVWWVLLAATVIVGAVYRVYLAEVIGINYVWVVLAAIVGAVVLLARWAAK